MTRPTALVTGASRGIGLAIARELASTHHLLLGGRDTAALEALAADLESAEPFAVDLTDTDRMAEAARGMERLDVLVHSAGLLRSGTVAQLTAQDWRDSFELNVVAPAMLTRALLPALRAAHGLVVTINSGSGFTSGPGGGAYSASKFALRALTDALREEERAAGVRVSSIHPGRVDTDMQHDLVAYQGGTYDTTKYLRPESVARAVRLAVDTTAEGTIEHLSIRPTRR